MAPLPTMVDIPEFSDAELADLNRDFETMPAPTIIEWAVQAFAPHMCLTASMTDAVLVDLATRVDPAIEVVFIDTGYHFPETLETERCDVAVPQGPETVHSGNDPGASVLHSRVAQRHPAGQVLLRLNVGVAVVLVPRKPAWLLGLLVDGLVPVEPDLGSDQILAEIGEQGVSGEPA